MHLYELSVTECLHGYTKKKFSCREVIASCLERIHQTEPSLHACMTVCDEASSCASDRPPSDQDLLEKPLWGIPVAVKDNYCTKGVRTTAASHVLDAFVPAYDATVWQKMRDAGAILVAKTNLDAWAHGSSTETSDYGVTHNPWDIARLPGGSSGGTAAAIIADQAAVGLGTETAGSIRQPASWCGVVGMKPTYGLVSRYGIVAMGSSLDSPGPMTKTVHDAALILNVIAGHDLLDATSAAHQTEDYTARLGQSIKGMKLGYSVDYFQGATAAVTAAVKNAFKTLESLGAVITEVKLFDPAYAVAVYTVIQRCEVSSNLARYDGVRYGYDRASMGNEARRRIMLGTYALTAGHADAYYHQAAKVRSLIIRDFARTFAQVDAIVAPSTPSPALLIGASADHAFFGEMADMLLEPSSIAGLPGISMPCGFAGGLPIGMQIIGPQFAEGRILQIASAYEQATDWHTRKPKLA